MAVVLVLRDRRFEVPPGLTVRQALNKIDVELESVLATRAGDLLTEDEVLRDGDVIKLVAVISGGCS
jgi:sulfur carrier protein ThiS